jgi:hypothetical protein
MVTQVPQAALRNPLTGERLEDGSRSLGIFAEGDFRQKIVEDLLSRIRRRQVAYRVSAEGVYPFSIFRWDAIKAIESHAEGMALSQDDRLGLADQLAEIVRVVATSPSFGASSFYMPGLGFRLSWSHGFLRRVGPGLVTADDHERYLSCPLWRRPIAAEGCLYFAQTLLDRLRDCGAVIDPRITVDLLDAMLDAGVRDEAFGVRRTGHDAYARQLIVLEWLIKRM